VVAVPAVRWSGRPDLDRGRPGQLRAEGDRPLPPGPVFVHTRTSRFRRACAGRVSTTPNDPVLNQTTRIPTAPSSSPPRSADANKQSRRVSASPGRRTRRPPCASRPAASGAAPGHPLRPALHLEPVCAARSTFITARATRPATSSSPPTRAVAGWGGNFQVQASSASTSPRSRPRRGPGCSHRLNLQRPLHRPHHPGCRARGLQPLDRRLRTSPTPGPQPAAPARRQPAVRRHDRHGRPAELQPKTVFPFPTTAASPRAARTAARATSDHRHLQPPPDQQLSFSPR